MLSDYALDERIYVHDQMCHVLQSYWCWLYRFIFLRSTPRVIPWLVVSFQVLRSAAYKQWNSSSTFYISEIFLPDTPCLEPRLEVFLHPQSFSIQSQVFSSFSSLGFQFPKKSLKLLILRLAIVQRKLQTSIMTKPVTVILVIVAIVVRGVPRMRDIPLVFLGSLQKLSKNNLGKPLVPKLAPSPVSFRLILWTKRRLSIVAQQVFIPKRRSKGLTILGHGTRSQMSLTLGCPSVENGAAILVLEQASMRLNSWGGFKLPLNAFAKELPVRLGLGICQFNPNAWRLVILFKFCRGKYLEGTVLLLWTSSSSVTSSQK